MPPFSPSPFFFLFLFLAKLQERDTSTEETAAEMPGELLLELIQEELRKPRWVPLPAEKASGTLISSPGDQFSSSKALVHKRFSLCSLREKGTMLGRYQSPSDFWVHTKDMGDLILNAGAAQRGWGGRCALVAPRCGWVCNQTLNSKCWGAFSHIDHTTHAYWVPPWYLILG